MEVAVSCSFFYLFILSATNVYVSCVPYFLKNINSCTTDQRRMNELSAE